jgi:hypothetical protein
MAWLCAMVATTLALATPTAEQFERGKTAFGRAEYARAISILGPLLYPETRLDSEAEVVQAHRMLGVAHLFENQPDEARREFRKLLELRPDYRLDPLIDPPRVVEFFNGVVTEEATEIAALDVARKKRDLDVATQRQREADARCAALVQQVPVIKNSFALNFLPFGVGQFQNRQRGKGWAFLGAEAGLGAVSVGALVTNFALFGLNPRRRCLDPQIDNTTVPRPCDSIDHSEEDLSRNLMRAQVISGALFFAVTAWGIVDAVRNYRATVPVDPEPSAEPGATSRKSPKPNPKSSPAPRPSARAGGYPTGFGLEWTF